MCFTYVFFKEKSFVFVSTMKHILVGAKITRISYNGHRNYTPAKIETYQRSTPPLALQWVFYLVLQTD